MKCPREDSCLDHLQEFEKKEQFFLIFLFPNMNWAREMENHSCYPCIITCSFIHTDQTLETYSCGEKGKKNQDYDTEGVNEQS